MTTSLQKYKRVFCWFKLVKLWGALRAHDAEGAPPATLSWELGVGLQGDIMRSKTTGAGRRVEVVQFHVSVNAWIFEKDWLRVGYELFVTMNKDSKSEARDFMMARPNENLYGLSELPSSLMSRDGRRRPLMPAEGTGHWSERVCRGAERSQAPLGQVEPQCGLGLRGHDRPRRWCWRPREELHSRSGGTSRPLTSWTTSLSSTGTSGGSRRTSTSHWKRPRTWQCR